MIIGNQSKVFCIVLSCDSRLSRKLRERERERGSERERWPEFWMKYSTSVPCSPVFCHDSWVRDLGDTIGISPSERSNVRVRNQLFERKFLGKSNEFLFSVMNEDVLQKTIASSFLRKTSLISMISGAKLQATNNPSSQPISALTGRTGRYLMQKACRTSITSLLTAGHERKMNLCA